MGKLSASFGLKVELMHFEFEMVLRQSPSPKTLIPNLRGYIG